MMEFEIIFAKESFVNQLNEIDFYDEYTSIGEDLMFSLKSIKKNDMDEEDIHEMLNFTPSISDFQKYMELNEKPIPLTYFCIGRLDGKPISAFFLNELEPDDIIISCILIHNDHDSIDDNIKKIIEFVKLKNYYFLHITLKLEEFNIVLLLENYGFILEENICKCDRKDYQLCLEL